jgi:DNA/RNA-binding domain of Phe-tRNA-synthetase-like protein
MSAAVRLPDGRAVALGRVLAERLRCGLLVAEQVQVVPAPALAAETSDLAARLRAEHAGKQPSEIPGLQEARRLYRACGMDPTRLRPSSEALLRRVLRGQDLYRINSAVDACNLASLSFLLPIGLYDLDRIAGDVSLRIGRAGEEYAGIRKGPVHLEGRLGLFDAAGPFGSPTSDSARTCVDESTHRLLAVVMATGGCPPATMLANLELLGDLFARHCGARIALRGLLPPEAS